MVQLTPQVEALKALQLFEEAMKTLESACCLYAEFTDFGDPYDDHLQPRRRELQRTHQSTYCPTICHLCYFNLINFFNIYFNEFIHY